MIKPLDIILSDKAKQASPKQTNEQVRIRAAQLYDLLMDEMRQFAPSVAESEECLAMMVGAYIAGIANSDSDAYGLISHMGGKIGQYFEACKRIDDKRKDAERIQYKLDN